MGKRKKGGGGPTPKKKKPVAVEAAPVEGDSKGRRRKRPRTAAIRQALVEEIEKALKSSGHPANDLFKCRDVDSGVPYAPFNEFAALLPFDKEKFKKIGSKVALLKMNSLTTMFTIQEDEQSQELVLLYAPIGTAIDNTVYLDNLPEDCNREKLMKLLKKFGTVVELEMPRRLTQSSGYERSSFLGFAIAQFTENDATDAILKKYESNAPGQVPRKPLTIVALWRKIRKWKTLRRQQGGNLTRRQRALMRPALMQYRRCIVHHRRVSRAEDKDQLKSQQRKRAKSAHARNHHKKKARRVILNWTYLRKVKRDRRLKKRRRNRARLEKTKARRAAAFARGGRAPKRVRFRRRRRNRTSKPDYIPCSIDEYFERVQVISFKEYVRLRSEFDAARDRSRIKLEEEIRNKHGTASDEEAVAELRDRSFSVKM